MIASGKNFPQALIRKDICIFIESTKSLMWGDAKNIVYSSFCSKGLEIIIRCWEILWGFCSVGKSRVLWSSSMLPGCGQGMDSMIHVISSSPLFLPGSLLCSSFSSQERRVQDFIPWVDSSLCLATCCPWDNSPVWIGGGCKAWPCSLCRVRFKPSGKACLC